MTDETNLWARGPEAAHEPVREGAPRPPLAFCRACGTQIDARAVICPRCGVAQAPLRNALVPSAPSQKSVALAILLSFLWPGAGHLYVGSDTEKGIVFTCISGLCFVISWTIIGLILTVPVWFVTALYTMLDSSRAAKRSNASLGAAPAL
jgi:TM2 domain-containing membrane protein YozV